MKILLFVAVALAISDISAGAPLSDECAFDPEEECGNIDFNRNYNKFLVNPCNCTEYVHCDKGRGGAIVAHMQTCLSPCLCFSTDTWSCSSTRKDALCPTETPITEAIGFGPDYCYRVGVRGDIMYLQPYQEATGSDQYVSYYWIIEGLAVKMPCAPGTYFDFDQCQCILCALRPYPDIPCATASNNVFCFDFDGDGAEKGISFDSDAQCSIVDGPDITGGALEFDGRICNIEVPFFANNEFRQFTFYGRFNRFSSGGNGKQGLIFNGNGPSTDCWPATIYVISVDSSHLTAGIVTDVDTYEITHSQEVATDQFNDFYLIYDGNSLDFVVGGIKESIPAHGVTQRTKCPLLIGESFDSRNSSNLFNGRLDTLCFYNAAIELSGE